MTVKISGSEVNQAYLTFMQVTYDQGIDYGEAQNLFKEITSLGYRHFPLAYVSEDVANKINAMGGKYGETICKVLLIKQQ